MATPTTDITKTREAFDAWVGNLPKARRHVARRGAQVLLNFWSKLHEDGLRPEDVERVARYAADQAKNALDLARGTQHQEAA